jgi:hypothetical protein
VRVRLLFLTFLLLGAIAMTALASSNGRRVVGDCRKSQVRPATIVLACADFNLQLTKLRWSSFGGASAHASGQYYVNDCTPYCAAGKFHSYPIKLVATGAKVCADSHDDYQRATVTFDAKRPAGQKTAREEVSLFCPLKG